MFQSIFTTLFDAISFNRSLFVQTVSARRSVQHLTFLREWFGVPRSSKHAGSIEPRPAWMEANPLMLGAAQPAWLVLCSNERIPRERYPNAS
jgi:hypothetical protein